MLYNNGATLQPTRRPAATGIPPEGLCAAVELMPQNPEVDGLIPIFLHFSFLYSYLFLSYRHVDRPYPKSYYQWKLEARQLQACSSSNKTKNADWALKKERSFLLLEQEKKSGELLMVFHLVSSVQTNGENQLGKKSFAHFFTIEAICRLVIDFFLLCLVWLVCSLLLFVSWRQTMSLYEKVIWWET